MKVALCGSLSFVEEINKIKYQLKAKGHGVILPPALEKLSLKNADDVAKLKNDKKRYYRIKPHYMKDYFDKILNSDAILVVNLEKNGIKNYIGGNTFAEIMFAFYYNKKVFFLNPIPRNEKFSFIIEEIEGVKPIVINGNLDLIK